ncbi:MAG: hypothetical protein ACOY3P_23105 [Planctomycetota bacterium]
MFIEALKPAIRLRAGFRCVQDSLLLQNRDDASHPGRDQAAYGSAGTLHHKRPDVRFIGLSQGDTLLFEPTAKGIHPANGAPNDAVLELLLLHRTDEVRQVRRHRAIAKA